MDSYNPMNMMMDHADRFEQMYPDTYSAVAPHVRDMVDGISDDGLEALTDTEMSQMTDEALRRSGLMANVPVGHTAATLGDLTRSVMVRDIVDRHRRHRRFPFGFPFFFFPFDGRFGHHHRDFGHGRDFDRRRFM